MAPLTPKERILKALRFEETDIVPYHVMIDDGAVDLLKDFPEGRRLVKTITNHLPFFNLESHPDWTGPDSYRDDFGCQWRVLDGLPHLVEAPLKEPTLAGYTFPDLLNEDFFAGVEEFLDQHLDDFSLCGIAYGFHDRAWALRGLEDFLIDCALHPAFVEEALECLTEAYLLLIDKIATYPFDGIRFGDDWGYQRGILIGARRWRQLVKPGLRKIFARAREKNLAVMVHSDGDVTEIIPDLIEMGVQILNPLQPEAMDVLEIKRRYGRQLCFNGGISSQHTLPLGTVEDVTSETLACLHHLGRGGGYIAGPSKTITTEIPSKNTAALLEALVGQTPERAVQEPVKQGPDIQEPGLLDDGGEPLRRVYRVFHPARG